MNNTPITDAVIEELSAEKYSDLDAYMAMSKVARRLERDRDSLMESLEDLMKVLVVVAGDQAPVPRIALGYAHEALTTARANFPEETP